MTDAKESIQKQLQALKASYSQTLVTRRETILHHSAQLQNKGWNEFDYNELYRALHTIAGSAETFGFIELTREARHCLNQLKQYSLNITLNGFPPELLQQISCYCDLLQKTCEKHQNEPG